MYPTEALDPGRPVLIAGPTACGKSELALRIAETQGGVIVNADALQVYDSWRVLSARPSVADEARAPHALYGHIGADQAYSVGHWLREVEPIIAGPLRPIIIGGTGLYLTALTEGLAPIPATPAEIRAKADALLRSHGLVNLLSDLDADTRARIDTANPMRVQRAWEVQHATGRSIAQWQDDTPPPLLPLDQATSLLIDAPKDWLTPRIEQRFSRMIRDGALDEARANLADYDPMRPSARAIGAPELIAHLRGEITLAEAQDRATIATRQFAKRQRTWFRARMKAWHSLSPEALRA
ncbi:tRNA (adenosine(37)-N6)-dimethylallyltransferase MiaA [Puniceibacterium sp. IMCC21224]|uniref:tRNA (adenosine(37)-N6)-dimethylallyltransferase MiaA n=1 Tax=Puniceibacterium sp. IMCC21224 TaxID=1618204 RepID=UPI00064DCD6E|nr:tRNA (adenosine(37)-N6)-dimethylallyltransferase MiaA [Puniceibacterium sp. IMCC21224]KMK67269.1 tRNA isopentenyltransferase MiaA [Puniceibacterium sp. IMCC21224]